MRNILRFILKYHFLLLFLFLEVLSFYLVINYNDLHKEQFLNSSGRVATSLFEVSSSFSDHFSLKRANAELSRENALLRSQLFNYDSKKNSSLDYENLEVDTIVNFIPSKVVNNSVNKLHNYLTIDKGLNDGIKPGMGVISARGLVGITRNVSKNYATITSLLNTQIKISSKLRDSHYFGTLYWSGQSIKHATLSEIPSHAEVEIGDAVVTSGFSSIFPENILIGTIEDFELNRGKGFYDITVRLSVDFSNLTYVETIDNYRKEERLQLENKTKND